MVELTQLDFYMEAKKMPPPKSSSVKRRRYEEEEEEGKEDAKHMGKERKAEQSRVEKALVAANAQCAPSSSTWTDSMPYKVRQGASITPPLESCLLFLPLNHSQGKKKETFPKMRESACHGL